MECRAGLAKAVGVQGLPCAIPRGVECTVLPRSQAPNLAVIHKALRKQQNPERVQAVSRGLSEATPPDGKINKISTPEGSQFFLRGLRLPLSKPRNCGIVGRSHGFMGLLLRPLRGRSISDPNRWCRFAQPPANGWQPYGLYNGFGLSSAAEFRFSGQDHPGLRRRAAFIRATWLTARKAVIPAWMPVSRPWMVT